MNIELYRPDVHTVKVEVVREDPFATWSGSFRRDRFEHCLRDMPSDHEVMRLVASMLLGEDTVSSERTKAAALTEGGLA